MTSRTMTRTHWIVLLLAALAIRLGYQLFVLSVNGTFDNGSDTSKYVWRALSILEHGSIQWNEVTRTGFDTERMPFYPYFAALFFWLGDGAKLHFVTFAQAFIDVGTIVAIALTAREFDHRYTLPVAILAAISPSLIIFSAWVLTDSLFLACLTWATFGCVRTLRDPKSNYPILMAAFFFALAMLIRPTLLFYWIVFIPVFFVLLRFGSSASALRSAMLALIPAIAMMAVVSAVATRNANNFGSYVVSTQTGNHAVQIVYSLLPFCDSCDVEGTKQEIWEEIQEQVGSLSAAERANPVIKDKIWRSIAFEYLAEIPPGAILRGVSEGVLRSVLQTSVYEAATQLRLTPAFFSAVEGRSFGGRLTNFAAEVSNSAYLAVWSIVQFLALASVPIQIVGIVILLRQRRFRAQAAFLMFTSAYVLGINGPIGSPKYGLPVVPTLLILTVVGGMWLYDELRKARASAPGADPA